MASNQLNRLDIDDTQPLSCSFLTTETNGDHIVYLVKVQRSLDPKYSWQIKKRYNEFKELNALLKISNYELALPPAKIFGNTNREFLISRQNGLQEFMDKILENLHLALSLPVKNFLDQENYSENYKELALAHVSMFFRSESNWQVIEPLNDIGWRFRKQHILLKSTEFPNSKFILTWCQHGPDKVLKEPELKAIFQQMCQIQYEYLDPLVRINSGDTSTIIIQKFNDKFVSLRDYINGITKINAPFMKKYSLHPKYQKIPVNLIKLMTKKILVALQFIYSKGLFYGHLHSGNVLIEQNGNTIKLTDLPNALLGLPSLYRSYIVEQRKIMNIELMDVYGFGHILYELVYGAPLITSSSRRDFDDCEDREIKKILEMLLAEDVLAKTGLPTINQLLELPFFKDTNIDVLPTSSFTAAASTSTASNSNSKLFTSQKVKECLMKAREFIEKRLNDEQKFVYKQKKQSQAEAKVLSEEEIKKRRKEKKKAEKEAANSLEFPSPLTSQSSVSLKSSKSKNNSVSSSSFSGIESPPPTPSTPISPNFSTGPPAPPPPPPPPMLVTSAPPPPPPPMLSSGLAPPPPPPPSIGSVPPVTPDRSQLLSSITGFSKGALKKTKTVDKSGPKI